MAGMSIQERPEGSDTGEAAARALTSANAAGTVQSVPVTPGRIPDEYPYVDSDQSASCGWFSHGKATVRTINSDCVERYDCRCGKFFWLSQANGERPIVRFRT